MTQEADLNDIARLVAAGQFEQALQHCDANQHANAGSALFWQLKVRALEGLRRWEAYAGVVEQGANLFPQDVELGLRQTQLQLAAKQHGPAIETIRRLPPHTMQLPVGATLMAQALWGDGQYSQAVEQFKHAVSIDPKDSRAQLALVRALLSLGKRERALQQLSDFLSLVPTDANGRFMTALSYVGQCSAEQLAERFASVLELAPDHQLARCGVYLAHCISGSGPKSDPTPGFPRDPLESAQKEAIDTLAPVATAVPFPTDVLLNAFDQAPAEGLILEFGVFHGRSLNLISARTHRRIFGFDSFSGLPEAWGKEPAGAYSTQGRHPQVPEHVGLVDGWFEDTLPMFVSEHAGTPAAFIHIDCDLYSSTQTILTHLDPHIVPGTVVVFDDYLGFPNAREHEFLAWREYTEAQDIAFRYLEFAALGREASLVVTGRGRARP